MDSNLTQVDLEIRDKSLGRLVTEIDINKVWRGSCLFLSLTAIGIIYFISCNRWLYLIPAVLGIVSFMCQMNIILLSSELRRRSDNLKEDNQAR